MPTPVLANAPPWMLWAMGELGVREKPGPDSTARILEYRKIAKIALDGEDSKVAWCAIFVNAALEATGFHGNRSAGAQNTKGIGVGLKDYALGAIITLGPGKGMPSWSGHTGFYRGHDSKGRVVLVGGNQGDAVSIAPFPAGRVIAIRWPTDKIAPQRLGRISFETGKPLQEVSDR